MAGTSQVQRFDHFGKNQQFCDRKNQLGSEKNGPLLTDKEEARRAADTAIAKSISRNFSCAW